MDHRDSHIYGKIKKEVSWWSYAAWSLPLIVIAALFASHVTNGSTVYHYILIGAAMTFFSISVFWWWWAIYRIRSLSSILVDTGERVTIVRIYVEEIKKEIVDSSHEHRTFVEQNETTDDKGNDNDNNNDKEQFQ